MALEESGFRTVGNKRSLSPDEQKFIDFCVPLRDYKNREKYRWLDSAARYSDKNNPGILTIEGNVFKELDYHEELNTNSTGIQIVSFLKTDGGLFLYRVSGGCVVYRDELFGPFIFKDKKFTSVKAK